MKILVIGSNSFSGSNFVLHALGKGYEVLGVSRSQNVNEIFLPYKWKNTKVLNENFRFIKIDLNKDINKLIEIIDHEKPSIIFNFAAQGMVAESWLNPIHWYQTNLLSQVSLHDQLRKRKFIQKYIHVTTPEVYGSTNNNWLNENTPFAPSTPYAVSRAACDLHLKSFFKAYDFPVVFTRSANVYGPGQQLFRIIPRTIISCKTKVPMQLHGGGKSIRSFIHIKDVVSATLTLGLEAENGSTWHLSTENAISIKDLVSEICNITKTNFEEIVEISNDRLGKDQTYLLNSDAMRESFGWKDTINLKEGLVDTIDWIEQNMEVIKMLSWEYQHKE